MRRGPAGRLATPAAALLLAVGATLALCVAPAGAQPGSTRPGRRLPHPGAVIVVPARQGAGATPARATPARATPAGATPAGSTPPRATPAGSPAGALRGRAGRRCAANLAEELAATGPALQLITVEAKDPRSTFADVTTWQRRAGCWVRVAGPFAGRIGVAGISQHKIEGDGTTPAGSFGVGRVMYGNGPNPGVYYSYHHLVCGDWWDEDPSSRWYNSFRHVACGARPAWTYGDSEALWTETDAYESFAWIEYNTDPVVPGRGSAIFLHDDTDHATAGCVSLPPRKLDTVLDWLRRSDDPRVVIGTEAEIRHY